MTATCDIRIYNARFGLLSEIIVNTSPARETKRFSTLTISHDLSINYLEKWPKSLLLREVVNNLSLAKVASPFCSEANLFLVSTKTA